MIEGLVSTHHKHSSLFCRSMTDEEKSFSTATTGEEKKSGVRVPLLCRRGVLQQGGCGSLCQHSEQAGEMQ